MWRSEIASDLNRRSPSQSFNAEKILRNIRVLFSQKSEKIDFGILFFSLIAKGGFSWRFAPNLIPPLVNDLKPSKHFRHFVPGYNFSGRSPKMIRRGFTEGVKVNYLILCERCVSNRIQYSMRRPHQVNSRIQLKLCSSG